MKVDFMIIGAMKSGTSSLAYQLRQHPDVCFSEPEETHYFSCHSEWRSGLDGYHRLFQARAGQIVGEGSTSYASYPHHGDVHARLHAYNPELKLIYLMRHPVERIVSHYAHNLLYGCTKARPEEEVLRIASYVNLSRYTVQISAYRELFPREQMMLLVFEEFVSNPRATLAKVMAFLGLASDNLDRIDVSPRNVSANRVRVKPFKGSYRLRLIHDRMPAFVRRLTEPLLFIRVDRRPQFETGLRRTLRRLLEADVRGVEEILGRQLDCWQELE